MFDFRNGMLGVVVVAVAIGAALFASYFAGIESVEHDVVKYNELADVTGLFDTETSPQYVDYDPSSNYTGYYSEETYSDFDGKYHFDKDRVYYESTRDGKVNNYKISFKPTLESSGTTNMNGVTDPLPNGYHKIYLTNTHHEYKIFDCEAASLKNWMETNGQSFAQAGNRLHILSVEGFSNDTMTDQTGQVLYNLNMMIFSTKSMWGVDRLGLVTHDVLNLMTKEKMAEDSITNGTNGIYMPMFSCKVYVDTGVVELFYDNLCNNYATTTTIDDVVIAYGSGAEGVSYAFNLGTTLGVDSYKYTYDYLDPNYGVSLMDELPSETVSALTLRSYAGGTYQITDPILEIESERSGSNYYFGMPSTVRLDVGETKNVNIYKRTDGDWFLTHVTVTIERVSP